MDAKQLVSVSVTRHFEASAETVYDAWFDPAIARKFLFATPQGTVVRCEIDAREGGKFVITDRRGDVDFEHVGEYLELSRPDHISFSFGVPQFSTDVSRVSVDIFPVPEKPGCKVTLLHDEVLADYQSKTHEGWSNILNALAQTLTEKQ
ncbi:MAG: SRPBCC domain-containing protein [Cyanobacteria bacterium SZAS LIN-2]|nr:SRPBCC domain-containing protein [Cyanobacteria bacterium SZAS LIN-2]MBS2006088.1 SRPBCC domain-containing protein [Cyanobacteria bacterium SZAS TMP-1]